jgi:hypothetical protein
MGCLLLSFTEAVMLIGHIGLGLAAKRAVPAAPLGVLLIAAEAADVLCGLFMVAGIEQMRSSPGLMAMSSFDFIYYPWSHGLVMTVFWSVLVGLLAGRRYGDRRTGVVIGLLIASHWVLDFLSHRPDLPLAFGGSRTVGLGLWNSVAGTLLVELGLLGFGVAVYLGMTHALDLRGVWSLWSLVVFFTGMFFLNHYAPQAPPEIPGRLLALPILVFVFLSPWGQWIERHRALRLSALRTHESADR